MAKFDYNSKIWGASEVRISPFFLGGLKLKRTLDDLKDVSGKVLDIGCGAGGMSKAIKFYRPDLNVFGVDISEASIIEANKVPWGVKFSTANISKLPFKDSFFDAVIIFDVLEHLDRPDLALNEANRVLKKSGTFSLYTPIEGNVLSIHGLAKRLFNFMPLKKYGGHIQQFSYEDIQVLIKTSNLLIARKRYFGHLFNQIADFSFFTILSIRGKNVDYSVEGYIAKNKGFNSSLISFLKSTVSLLSFVESRLLWFIPVASGVHIKAIKSG